MRKQKGCAGMENGIKRKIKRRITLFHIYRMWTRTRRGGTTASFSNIHGSIFFFFSFFYYTFIFGNFYHRISKDGRSRKKGREINSNRYARTYTFHNREGGVGYRLVRKRSSEGSEREREEGKLIKRKERWFLATDSRKSL